MDIDRLKLLASKVEEDCRLGAQILAKALASEARDRGEFFPAHDVSKAMCGSLDAAKALHEALLPGWTVSGIWQVREQTNGQKPTGEWNALLFGVFPERYLHAEGICKIAARAWLLAILRALIAENSQ